MTTSPLILGSQCFDGLGRPRSLEVAGRVTHYHYRPGQIPPTGNTLPDGQRLDFTYEPQLGDALLSAAPAGQAATPMHYHSSLHLPIDASNGTGTQRWAFSPAGRLVEEAWEVEGETFKTALRYSPGGLLLGFTDASGTEHQRQYDAAGRLAGLKVGQIETLFNYDALSRLASTTTLDASSGQRLQRCLAYDAMSREASSIYTVEQGGQTHTFTQHLAYSALGQVTERTWDDGLQVASERFTYDSRGRLVHYRTDSAGAAPDAFGNAIVEQRFTLNALDGYTRISSLYADGSQDLACFRYSESDPTQVVSISHTHPSWPALIELSYDDCGRVVADSLGRTLSWDSQDRLVEACYRGQTCQYRYDPSGRLCERAVGQSRHRSFFCGDQRTHEHTGEQQLGLVGNGTQSFAVTRAAEGVHEATLLGCDSQGSVCLEAGDSVRRHRYTPHGAGAPEGAIAGYTGEHCEPLTGWYIAAGNRPYDPVLMCFLSPDSHSPFGRGGLNAYAYCSGDPINRIDPDGHSWVGWTMAGVGLAISAVVTVASIGSVLPALAGALAGGLGSLSASAALSIGTATLNVVSLGTGAGALARQATGQNDSTTSILGWISLGAGVASMVTGLAAHATSNTTRMAGRAGALRNPDRAVTKPLYWEKQSAVLFEEVAGNHDVAMHNNLWGQGIRGFETHGSKGGQLMNAAGKMDDPARLAIREIAPRLAGLPADEPIMLLACYGGRSGAAQKIADVLQRPVYGYDKMILVSGPRQMQWLDVCSATTNIPQQVIPKSQRWLGMKGPFSWYPEQQIASGRLYFPSR